MHRLDEYSNELNIHSLTDMANEFKEMYDNELRTLLDRANSKQFNYHYEKLEEIKWYRKEINKVINRVNEKIINL